MTLTKQQMHDEIMKIIESEPALSELSITAFRQVAKAVVFDSLKEKLKNELHKRNVDQQIETLREHWLSMLKTENTRRSYDLNVRKFLSWLGKKSIVDVKARTADNYLKHLSSSSPGIKPLSNNTIIQRLAAISKFFDFLVREDVLKVNPFRGMEGKPKKELEIRREEDVTTDEQIDQAIKFAKEQMSKRSAQGNLQKHNTQKVRLAAKKAYAALVILRETGIRISALSTLTINSDLKYNAPSKRGNSKGILRQETHQLLVGLGFDKHRPFKGYTAHAFRMWIRNVLPGGRDFSIHGIRARFSVEFYKNTKDVIALKNRLGHKEIRSSQAYLTGLKDYLG